MCKKGNLVFSPAELDLTIFFSPFPPQTTGTLSPPIRFVSQLFDRTRLLVGVDGLMIIIRKPAAL